MYPQPSSHHSHHHHHHHHHHPASNPRSAHAVTMSPQRFQRSQHPGQHSTLRLPSLPKFHPAAYASPETSNPTTPSSTLSSPGALSSHSYAPTVPTAMSPRRQYSEAQRHLLQYQRELISSRAPKASTGSRSPRPASPHLQPLGSPGPVTPLELEEGEANGYLFAGVDSELNEHAKDQILDVYIQKEAKKLPGKRRRDDAAAYKSHGRDHSGSYNGRYAIQ